MLMLWDDSEMHGIHIEYVYLVLSVIALMLFNLCTLLWQLVIMLRILLKIS